MTCTYGELSKLGFGFMRLPTVEVDGEKVIDIELVKEMAAHPEVDFMQTLSDSARARSAEMGRRAQGHEAFALCEPSGKALER